MSASSYIVTFSALFAFECTSYKQPEPGSWWSSCCIYWIPYFWQAHQFLIVKYFSFILDCPDGERRIPKFSIKLNRLMKKYSWLFFNTKCKDIEIKRALFIDAKLIFKVSIIILDMRWWIHGFNEIYFHALLFYWLIWYGSLE